LLEKQGIPHEVIEEFTIVTLSKPFTRRGIHVVKIGENTIRKANRPLNDAPGT